MDENQEKNDHIILEANIGTHDIISLKLGGKLTNDRFYAFVDWTEKVKKLVRESSERNPGKILMLTDVTGVTHFESKPIGPVRELLNYNKQFRLKSAVVGAKDLTRVLLDTLISLTGRDDIRQFPTKEEAFAWLLKADEPETAVAPTEETMSPPP